MFGNLIEIIGSQGQATGKTFIHDDKTTKLIRFEEVDEENLPEFVSDLEVFVTKLDEALVHVYQYAGGSWVKLEFLLSKLSLPKDFYFSDLQERYEQLLQNLKVKQSRLKYLSSYFETTKQSIEAAKKNLEDRDVMLKEAEERSKHFRI